MTDYHEQHEARARTLRAEAAQERLARLAACCTSPALARRLVALRQRVHAALRRQLSGGDVCCA